MAQMTMKAARVNVGLAQKDAAKKLGVSNKTLSLWEAGKSFPTANRLPSICALYKCKVDELIFLPNGPLSADQ